MVFSIGSYYPANSYLHIFDPVLKIIMLVMLTVAVLVSVSPYVIGGALILLLAGSIGAQLRMSMLFRQFRVWIWLFVFVVILHLFIGGGEPVVSIWGIEIGTEGLNRGVLYGFRFIVFLLSAYLLTATTSPNELTDSFIRMLYPLKIIRLPVEDISLVMSITLRFIPVMYDEAIAIKTAQQARGVEFSKRSFLRTERLSSLLIPLFFSVIRRTADLNDAMLSKGYLPGMKRSSYFQRDVALSHLIVFILVTAGCIFSLVAL
ncbi:MAG: hypothetical protein GF307_11110 [candidate division Zixibacteria bacterium]|nr:hypothetical protein [candidate division Zixibacteria bacterium]